MGKFCPIIQETVLYTECLECEEKLCKKNIETKVDKNKDKNKNQ